MAMLSTQHRPARPAPATPEAWARRAPRGIERDVALSGIPAVEWLKVRGWKTLSSNLRVFADVFDAARFGYARTWLSPGRYEKIAPSGAPSESAVTAILLVEGSAEIDLGAGVRDFQVGDMALVGGDTTVLLDADTPVAIYEIVTDYERMGLSRYNLPPTSGPHSTSPDYWPALAGVINQVLGSSVSADDFGISSVRTAVESLLLAALKESTAMSAQQKASHEHHHLRRARAIIHDEAHSPDFSVAQLAEMARVSRAHLHRMFAAEGSTPLAEIKKTRVELARLHLAEGDASYERDPLSIARSSGFQTVTAMRRALRGA